MKLPSLQYVAPRSISEACQLLADDDDAKVLAGGQSLMPLLAIRLASPTTVVDIGNVEGLRDIEQVGSYVKFGALVTHEAVIDSPLVQESMPFVAEAGHFIAHAQIRSRGTLGGSIAHGDGAGEWPLMLLTMDGMVEVESVRGRRTVEADDLFVGPYMTSLSADEIITDVWIPQRTTGWSFQEVARRIGDYGLAIIGCALDFEDEVVSAARITVGAAAGSVQRIPAAEEAVVGLEVNSDLAVTAGAAAAESLNFISDIHGSTEYRRHLVRSLVERAINQAGGRR